jgi:hypothetical protein
MCIRRKLAVGVLAVGFFSGTGLAADAMRGSLAGDGTMAIRGDAGEIIFSPSKLPGRAGQGEAAGPGPGPSRVSPVYRPH